MNGLYKAELVQERGSWKTRSAIEIASLEWLTWFNDHRLLSSIGYCPPPEAEANYNKQLATPPVAD